MKNIKINNLCKKCNSSKIVIRNIRNRGLLNFFIINPLASFSLILILEYYFSENVVLPILIQFLIFELMCLYFIFGKKYSIYCKECGHSEKTNEI